MGQETKSVYWPSLKNHNLMLKERHRLRVKRWKKVLQLKVTRKKAGTVILTSDKIDFKTKLNQIDNEGQII